MTDGHAGTRCDVDGVWEQGRIEVARDACMRDARAMAEVALARAVRSADGREIGALRSAVVSRWCGVAESQ